jgi:hypothetical protein
LKRLIFAALVALVVVIVVMSRRQQDVENPTDVLGDRIDHSTLPDTSKAAMRELLSQGRFRPSQFDATDESHATKP